MRLLLHTCCAPCATHCILVLRQLGYEVTLFFSNANIATQDEFAKRLDAVRHLAEQMKVDLLIDEPDYAEWCAKAAKGFELEPERGARCERCFRYSLGRTYEAMRKHGFDRFTTTLSVSPHKNTPTLFKEGRAIDADHFLAINFKKDDGFKHSLQLAAEFGLYRQNYCGCEFSKRPFAAE